VCNTGAGWERLRPFFDLPGTIVVDGDRTVVTFSGFTDRRLNCDLAAIGAKVRERQPRLPDGTTLIYELVQHRGLMAER